MNEERVMSLLSQSNQSIFFNVNTPVHGLNIRYGMGNIELHFYNRKDNVSQVWKIGNISARVKCDSYLFQDSQIK
jgi:hypothetical protein